MLAAIAFLALASCSKGPQAPDQTAPPAPAQAAPAGPVVEDAEKIPFDRFRGKVLVLMLGVVGCGGTDRMYTQLLDLRKEMTQGVEFLRIDYQQSVAETKEYYKEKPPTFAILGDPSGKIGDSLPSQAMPTLFVASKWGEIRYTGGLKHEALKKMVDALRDELKPNPANFFKDQVLGKGDMLKGFKLKALDGNEFSLVEFCKDAKGILLVFAGTSCPHSQSGMKTLNEWYWDYKNAGVNIVAVNSKEDPDKTREVYTEMGISFPVLLDGDGKVAGIYDIDAVPTVFVADAVGKVLLRTLWNADAISQEVDLLLGRIKPEDRQVFDEEGTG